MIILGVLVDTLQPPHVGVKQAYDFISKARGPQYTFITVTDKKQAIQSDITEPLTHQDKEQILIKHGIPKDRLIKGNSYFDISELEKRFDPTDTAIVFYFFSDKSGFNYRINNDKILPWYEMNVSSPKFQSELKPMSESVYYQIIPNNIKRVKGLNLTTKLFIEELGDPKNSDDNKKTFFALAFGWYDAGFYNLVKERFSQPYEKLVSKYSSALSQPSLEKTVQEIVNVLVEDLSSMLSDTPEDKESPTERAKQKTINVTALRQKQKTLNLNKQQSNADAKLNKDKLRKMTQDYNDDKAKVAKGEPITM